MGIIHDAKSNYNCNYSIKKINKTINNAVYLFGVLYDKLEEFIINYSEYNLPDATSIHSENLSLEEKIFIEAHEIGDIEDCTASRILNNYGKYLVRILIFDHNSDLSYKILKYNHSNNSDEEITVLSVFVGHKLFEDEREIIKLMHDFYVMILETECTLNLDAKYKNANSQKDTIKYKYPDRQLPITLFGKDNVSISNIYFFTYYYTSMFNILQEFFAIRIINSYEQYSSIISNNTNIPDKIFIKIWSYAIKTKVDYINYDSNFEQLVCDIYKMANSY